ncbi:hypothetical protein [[Phormidium] sp. ETS-05]|nr:hypothetical protein [[Phormidium] sp. ETS-05]
MPDNSLPPTGDFRDGETGGRGDPETGKETGGWGDGETGNERDRNRVS